MRRAGFIAIAWMILCLAWPAFGASRAMEDEEYRVYRAFLDSPYAEKPNDLLYEKLGIFFIYNVKHENPGELQAFFRNRAGLQLDVDLFRSFVAANKSPKRIDRKRFIGNVRYSPQFIQKDVYSLSRVGFSARMDEALFYASYASLMEDGHGSLIYLKKTGGTWSVAKAAAVWMYGASVHPFNP